MSDVDGQFPKRQRPSQIDFLGLLVDWSQLRPKDAMQPGVRYARPGAFVRKPITPRKKPLAKDAVDDELEDEIEAVREEKPCKPSKAAVEAAKRAAKIKIQPSPQLGSHDSASVRERVRKWQSQGGGVVTASDIAVEFEDSDDEDIKLDTLRSRSKSPVKERWGARQEKESSIRLDKTRSRSPVKADTVGRGTTRSVGAPPKRIISDSHWQQAKNERSKANVKASRVEPDDGIRIRPMRDEVTEDTKRAGNSKNYPDDGIRVYSARRRSRRASDQDTESRSRSIGSYRKGSDHSDQQSEILSQHSADDTEVLESEHPIKPPARKDTRRSARGIFGAVFQESKKMFTRTETVYIPTPENPRIDNWLGEIPDLPDDPFINDEKSTEDTDFVVPKSRRRRKSKASEVTSPDPNGIWEAVSTVETLPESAEDLWRRQRRRRRSSANHEEHSRGKNESQRISGARESAEPFVTEDGTTKSLSRRGARRKSTYAAEEPLRDKHTRNTLGVAALQALFSANKEVPVKSTSLPTTPRPSSVEPLASPPVTTTKRPFPSVGAHKLSTIASMSTLQTETEKSVLSEISADSDFTTRAVDKPEPSIKPEPDRDGRRPRRKKTRLTRHADLISVLSAPRAGGKSIRSARSVRTQRTPIELATIPDLLKEITDDEIKYMRELRTLVDGVIPVLLSSVLSKAESATIASLFSPLGQSSPVGDTIYAMGVALEGLKKWHKRLEPGPSGPIAMNVFLTWAQGVHRTYKDYLRAWRMGFQDVIVNLAPAAKDAPLNDDVLDKGLPRNDTGDVIDAKGERVDVAFLLKRPLVRLKYLAKTLKNITLIQPSMLAEKLAADYQTLIEEARHRVNEEKARLEDEAAAVIDSTRARNVTDLALVTGVTVNKTRRVRARDMFDLSLAHSNGQRVDCKVELFLRDDPPGSGSDTDVLVCQMDSNGKWLLFPPISVANISARNGDLQGEIIVMIRGKQENTGEWWELLSLTTEDEQTGFEWVQMLGLVPVPPQLFRGSSFVSRRESRKTVAASVYSDGSTIADSLADSALSPRHYRVPTPQAPLGEQVPVSARTESSFTSRSRSEGNRSTSSYDRTPRRSRADSQATCMTVLEEEPGTSAAKSSRDRAFSVNSTPTPRSLNEAMSLAGSPASTLGRRRVTGKRPESMCISGLSQSFSNGPFEDDTLTAQRVRSSPIQSSSAPSTPSQDQTRPGFNRQNSSTPSSDLPAISKLRKTGPRERATEVHEDSTPRTVRVSEVRPVSPKGGSASSPPPSHRISSPLLVSRRKNPEFEAPASGKRRSSSPLKHQYQPTTASDDGSDTSSMDDEYGSDEDLSSTDDDDSFEMDDVVGPLPQEFQSRQVPASQPSLPSKTLGPSSSASQAPYKTVPAQPNKALRAVAIVSYWSDKNSWINLQPDVCSVIVTPGLVEIYEMSAAHSFGVNKTGVVQMQSDMPSPAAQPLLVLHLTPMVLLQQGTALDVTVRSPPQGGVMKDSITGVNFLFRARSPEEAENLYGMLHHSRMNNPTYIALQQARATAEKTTFDPAFGRKRQTSTSWFKFGRQNSYRAQSVPTPRAKSDPSVGTRTTSFSAKLFGNGRFNIARSTIMSRVSPNGSVYTSSDNSLGSGTSTPIPVGIAGIAGNATAPLGLSNTKIRLYSREGSRWLDMGSASLTIMRPEEPVDLNSPPAIGYAHGVGKAGVITPTQKRSPGDKRVVVISAKKDLPLLDVVLGESCFERTARTGIALSLWELFEGGTVADRGGVTNGRFKYFMMQFPNEAACAFTFSLVGRHRY